MVEVEERKMAERHEAAAHKPGTYGVTKGRSQSQLVKGKVEGSDKDKEYINAADSSRKPRSNKNVVGT